MPSLGDFLYAQFILGIPKPSASFASKTVIITGANRGLGKEVAQHVIRLGADKVIFGCRSLARGSEAKSEVEALLKCSPEIIQVWEVHLESPSSIEKFVSQANALPRLDGFVSNAGIISVGFKVVYDTERRYPRCQRHRHLLACGPADTKAQEDSKRVPDHAMNQYNLSKLLQLYIIRKLCAVVDPDDASPNPIVINSVDPCFCKTGLSGDLKGGIRVLFKIFEWIPARTAEEGSRLVVQALSATQRADRPMGCT